MNGAWRTYYYQDGVGSIVGSDGTLGEQCFSFDGRSYNYTGQGECIDKMGSGYDRAVHYPISSLDKCKGVCETNSTDFVGLEFDGSFCSCLYNDDKAPSQPFNDTFSIHFGGSANGEIIHSEGGVSDMCYAYINSHGNSNETEAKVR